MATLTVACSDDGGSGEEATDDAGFAALDGETDEDREADRLAGLAHRQRATALEPTEVRIGRQVVSELSGAPAGSSASQVGAAQASEAERTLEELGAVRTSEGLVVTLPETVLFDFDDATVRRDAAATLDDVAQVIGFYDVEVLVQGHTDSKGPDDYNEELSQRRADAVRDALVERGVPAGQVAAEGFGERRPVAPNEVDGRDNPEGQQRNRRVEIVLRDA